MKIIVDQIDSITPCVDGKSSLAVKIDVKLTEEQAQRIFYDIWERFDIKPWIEAEGCKLEE